MIKTESTDKLEALARFLIDCLKVHDAETAIDAEEQLDEIVIS